ncbi:hypothetical protein UA08_02399 [Talaromyces atroroseus]|uniref:Telomerase reverse transcriptase n=1 Tax=Talaromyces atroroseus TaxID=1441469 RepID=A0A225AWJ5_TALAT|nr:hypothetical protein UA08_02399 [Talaromyces atroroseus]OKL61688.1 hypothetical protein UA08_02399 [Talaromyces atroroseus]
MGKKRKRPQKTAASQATHPQKIPRINNDKAAAAHEHPVLSRYYPRVVTLRQYLLEELPSSSKARRRQVLTLGKPKHARSTDISVSTSEKPTQRNEGTDMNLAHFLDSTLVGIRKDVSPAVLNARHKELVAFMQSEERSTLFTDTEQRSAQSEVVDYAIEKLLNQDPKPPHILTNGFYRTTRREIMDHGIGAMTFNIPGVTLRFPNPKVTALKSSPWTDILTLLGSNGEDIMSKLLLDCGIFSCVNEGKAAFHQISGTYLSELEPIDVEISTCQDGKSQTRATASKKSPSTMKLSKGAAPVLHKSNSIVFVRRRMLYARPAINSKGDVRFGLRHIHVLNRFPNSNDIEQTVHVMKYIFPRQFGLHNAFTSAVDSRETVQPFKDYTLREEEIARLQGPEGHRRTQIKSKLPKRLRGSPLQLVQKLQKRSQTCSYTALLRHYCPLSETGLSKLAVLPCSSDDKGSQQLITQTSRPSQSKADHTQPEDYDNLVFPDSTAPSIEISPITSTRKICLLDHASPTSSVSAFCRATLRKLIPHEFFGQGEDGASNLRTMMKQIDRFIRLSRFESLTLHEVCKGFKITCLRWLEPPSCPSSRGLNISLSDLRKRTEILHEFVYYIFDSLLIPLIRTNFYVTESQVHKNRLFYFRHDVWRSLIEKPLIDMKSSMFEEIKRDKVSRVLGSKKLSWSAVRLLPKATGVRPIINLRRRVAKYYGSHSFLGPSTNSTMTPVFNILSYEKDRNPDLLGSSMFSVGDMYARLKSFKDRLRRPEKANLRHEQLYFVKLDIQSCFDTIPQRSLVSLIESLVTEDVYHITKHVEIRPGDGSKHRNGFMQRQRTQKPAARPIRKFLSKARGLKEILNPTVNPPNEARNLKRNTIQVDTAAAKNHQINTLLDLLSEHIRKNLVKIGKKYYRQKNGIPQGSVLSSLLCNFFYGKLEQEVLGFLKNDDTLLLRLIDDFLLITAQPELAKRFLQVMMDGQPAYGITVNAGKSLVNFEATINGTKLPRLEGSTSFPYCGNLIDTHSLAIRKDRDYGRGRQTNVADTLTVESSRIPGQAFYRKVLTSFRLQTHSMFLDTEHNNLRTALLGIYSNFVETAIKMYRYIKSLLPRLRPSQELVLETIRDVIHFAVKLIQSKRQQASISSTAPTTDTAKGMVETGPKFRCAVSQAQVEYLGSAAFRHILGRKQTNFVSTLRGLQNIQNRCKPRSDKEVIRMRWIIQEGNKMFDNWRY